MALITILLKYFIIWIKYQKEKKEKMEKPFYTVASIKEKVNNFPKFSFTTNGFSAIMAVIWVFCSSIFSSFLDCLLDKKGSC